MKLREKSGYKDKLIKGIFDYVWLSTVFLLILSRYRFWTPLLTVSHCYPNVFHRL